ncbi:MAG: endonuclease III [Alphaproteobacteria bacterium]|nr:endonuclease III [Alphaproteobacteria bacterium]
MLNKSEIEEIFERLKQENPNPTSELVAHNAFTFVLAVLLSAQTTDKMVNKVTKELFAIADTPEKILDLGIDRLKEYIHPLGFFNNKAKNVMMLSKVLIEKYSSQIPTTRDELEQLPGIGRKSANVIANRLFGADTIAVDTHVLRVSQRLGLTVKTDPLGVEGDLLAEVPVQYHKNASDWLVLHGRYICTAKKPKCHECCLFDLCKMVNG